VPPDTPALTSYVLYSLKVDRRVLWSMQTEKPLRDWSLKLLKAMSAM
jgi:hypothetical protein